MDTRDEIVMPDMFMELSLKALYMMKLAIPSFHPLER